MQKLSVWEFKKFWDSKTPKPHEYIFYTENQDGDIEKGTVRMKLAFDAMQIRFNPNTIYLKSGKNFLSFEKVKHIKIQESSIIGEAFTVVCGEEKKSFTIVAQ